METETVAPVAAEIGLLVMQPLSQGNTLNLNDEQKKSEIKRKVEAQMEALFQKQNWKTCKNCTDDWTKLYEDGLCPSCEEIILRRPARDSWFIRAIGKFAYENYTLEKFKERDASSKDARFAAIAFRPAKDNLILRGPCGSGKTHLAIALMNEWYDALQGAVGFERPHSLLRFLRGKMGSEEDAILESLAHRKLLIIDDLGLGKQSDYMLQILYEIVSDRLQDGRNGLIITTNLTIDDIAQKFGDDRLTSRLTQMCQVVTMDSTDLRGEIAMERGLIR